MGHEATPGRHAEVEVADALIPSDTAGVELFLRNKRLKSGPTHGSILLVHGATFSSLSLFDVDVAGGSFLDMLARAGLDVWALDVRGYGGSTRLAGMEAAPSSGTPLVRAVEAVNDLQAAIEYIRRSSAPKKLVLLGMSWGGSVAGMYASRSTVEVDALVLVAPLWLSAQPLRVDPGTPILTHRQVNVAAFRAAWLAAAPEAERNHLLPTGWFERWAQVTTQTDLDAAPGFVRAPSGAIADVREHWTAGRPLYDPAAIKVPTMIIRGTWDVDMRRDMALDLFDHLTNARHRVYSEVAGGTHMLLLEPVRAVAFEQIIGFVNAALLASLESGVKLGV